MSWKALETVYVSHSFEAKEHDEITINEGEIVQVIEKDDVYKDGWWQGRNVRGEIGLFPVNYTSLATPGVVTLDHKIGSLEYAISELHHVRCRSPSVQPPPFSNKHPALVSNQEKQQQTMPRTTSLHQKLNVSLVLPELQSISPDKWTVDQVAMWAKTIGVETVAETFRDQEITGDILLELTPELLKELGITTFGKRFKVHSAIKILKDKLNIELQNANPSSKYTAYSPDNGVHSQTSSIESTQSASWQQLQDPGGTTVFDHPSNNGYYCTAPVSGLSISLSAPIGQMQSTQLVGNELVPRVTNAWSGTQQTLVPFTSLDRVNNTKVAGKQLPSHETLPTKEVRFDPTVQDIPLSPSKSWPSSNYQRFFFSLPPTNPNSGKHANGHGMDTWKPDMEGWLHKRGDKYKTWSKRWFILKGPNLFYFKKPRDSDAKAVVCLTNYRILTDELIHPGKYCFKAQNDRDRTLYFYVDSEQSMKDWVHALLKATIVRDYNTPVLTSSRLKTVTLDVAQRMKPRPPSIIMQPKQTGYPSNHSTLLHNRPFSLTYQPGNSGIRTSRSEISMNHAHTQQNDPRQNHQRLNGLSRSTSISGLLQHSKYRVPEEDTVAADPLPRSRHLQLAGGQLGRTIKWSKIDYIDWVNQYISQPIDRLDEMRVGEPLVELLERISRKPIQRPVYSKPRSPGMHMLDIIVTAFAFMGREGIKLNGGFTIKEVFNGNEENTMRMLDAIRSRWEL